MFLNGFQPYRVLIALVATSVLSTSAFATSLIPAETSLGLDTVGYLNASDSAPKGFQNSISPQLVGKWNGLTQGQILEAGVQSDLLLVFTGAQDGSAKPVPYFEIPELYVGTSRELAPVQLHLGRKLEHWSHLDEQWELGLWQPRFRWDYLHPESVGLTGAFFTVDLPLFHFMAYGSPLFIPERGVPVSANDGALSSDSRWFVPPPSVVSIFHKDTAVRYSLQMPEMQELLLHWGTSVQARVGAATGPWGSLGGAFKPMNQLLLANGGKLRTVGNGLPYADATIYPRVEYQRLLSVEGGYASEPLNTTFSVLSESPLRDSTPASWTTQEAQPALLVGSMVDFRIAGTPARPTRLDLSYLRGWGGNAGDQGPDSVGGNLSSFEARYPLSNAVAVGMKSPIFSHLSGSSRFLYDIGHEGTVWSTELRYQARASWVLGLGADLLTSAQNDDPENSDLLGRYRANDRVHAGVTYVF